MRALNIALRTAHIASMGVLLGGVALAVPHGRLEPSVWLTLGTGLALALVETGGRATWFHEGRGLMTLFKLALLCCVLLAPDYRLAVLLAVVAVASVGSHMPRRFRHYSVLYRRVIPARGGIIGAVPGPDE